MLIVDDDMRNIFALSTVLEDHDMDIVSADNGRDAITILQEEPDVDIVLMDIMMPEMDGMETMREIRKIPQLEEPADRRRDRQGHEGRPREVHRGRRVGLPVQAGRHRADAGGAAGVAARAEESMPAIPREGTVLEAPTPSREVRSQRIERPAFEHCRGADRGCAIAPWRTSTRRTS